MFSSPESAIDQDLAAPAMEMKALLAERGHGVATIDTAPLDSFDAIVFLDHPTRFNRYFRQAVRRGSPPLYLVLLENRLIRPDNYWKRNHAPFRKIFTWNDDWVDGRRYIKFFNAVGWRPAVVEDQRARRQLCVMTVGNKFSTRPEELYSARRETLNWFAEHAPDDLALYGEGWDRWHVPAFGFIFNALVDKAYRRCPSLPRRPAYPFWKGFAKDKAAVLTDAKFSICYENAVFPGYITEKIFDCFFAGCVPVYLGPPNAARYLPRATHVDARQFATCRHLYDHLRGMSDRDYRNHRAAIADFLASDAARLFSGKHMTDIILEHVVGELAVQCRRDG
jgi:hypothetical protein